MADQWLTPDEQQAWRAYVRAGSLLTARLNRLLQADCGLSLPEYEVLVQLSEAPQGKLRPFQLGLALDWEQSRLSHMLSRMSRRGFVARQDCAGDRRGADVVLTAAGRAGPPRCLRIRRPDLRIRRHRARPAGRLRRSRRRGQPPRPGRTRSWPPRCARLRAAHRRTRRKDGRTRGAAACW